jgi:hypothetical protein
MEQQQTEAFQNWGLDSYFFLKDLSVLMILHKDKLASKVIW